MPTVPVDPTADLAESLDAHFPLATVGVRGTDTGETAPPRRNRAPRNRRATLAVDTARVLAKRKESGLRMTKRTEEKR